jgi:hypothetical protein
MYEIALTNIKKIAELDDDTIIRNFCTICFDKIFDEIIDTSSIKQNCQKYNINYDKLNDKSRLAMEIISKFFDFEIINRLHEIDINDTIYNDIYHKFELYLRNKYGSELAIYILHKFVYNRIQILKNNIDNIMGNSPNNKQKKRFIKKHIGHVNYALSLIRPRLNQFKVSTNHPCATLIKKDYKELVYLSKFNFEH